MAPANGPRPRLFTELLIVLGLVWVYDVVRGLAHRREGAARGHGEQVLGLERLFHLDWEAGANRWLSGHDLLARLASSWYEFAHVWVTLAVLAWCYVARPDLYRRARNALVGTNLVGLAVFAALPVMPPRLLQGHGFVDSVDAAGYGTNHGGPISADQYAAMPSLHLAWATWVVLVVVAALPAGGRRPLIFSAGYCAVTAVVVVATANHFVLDVVAGVATARACWSVANRRPAAVPATEVVEAVADDRPRIVVISASVGGGHDGAARELARRLDGHGFRVEILDFMALLPRGMGRSIKGAYMWQLKVAPWSYQALYALLERHVSCSGVVRGLTRLARRRIRRACAGPDVKLVVSTYPLSSQVLGSLRRKGRLRVPVATVLTDFSVHRLWVSPHVDLHLALHQVSARQARALGAGQVRVVSPLVPPAFAAAAAAGPAERAATRARLGLPAQGQIAVLTAGSWGVGEVAETAVQVAASGLVIPAVVCGQNEELRASLADRFAGSGPGVALGWVNDMPGLLGCADVVVQNAGGLTCLEAFAAGVPVASYRSIPGHGRTNAAAMDEAGVAVWVREDDALASAVRSLVGDRGASQADAAARLFRADDPAELCAALAVPVRERVPAGRRVRRAALTAGVLAGVMWLGTEGTEVAVAHGFNAVQIADAQGKSVFVVVRLDEKQAASAEVLAALQAARAAVAVDKELATARRDLLRHLTDAGIPLVNVAGVSSSPVGVVRRDVAIVTTARTRDRLDSDHPSLLLADRHVDAIDVGLARLTHQRIVLDTDRMRPGEAVPVLLGRQVILVDARDTSQSALLAALAALQHAADFAVVRLSPVTELPR